MRVVCQVPFPPRANLGSQGLYKHVSLAANMLACIVGFHDLAAAYPPHLSWLRFGCAYLLTLGILSGSKPLSALGASNFLYKKISSLPHSKIASQVVIVNLS